MVDTRNLYLPRAGHSTVGNTSPYYKLISWVFNILIPHWAQIRFNLSDGKAVPTEHDSVALNRAELWKHEAG